MDVPVLADQQEIIYIRSVLDVVWKTYRERRMIGTDRKRGFKKIRVTARFDDDDDVDDDNQAKRMNDFFEK